jgi:hypothetical protein
MIINEQPIEVVAVSSHDEVSGLYIFDICNASFSYQLATNKVFVNAEGGIVRRVANPLKSAKYILSDVGMSQEFMASLIIAIYNHVPVIEQVAMPEPPLLP